MSLSDDIKKINAEISKLSKQLGQTPPLFDAKDLKIAKGYLTGLRSDVKEINSDLKFVADSFRDSVNELSKQNTYLSQSKSALKGISSISLKLLEIKKGEVKANDEDIKKLRQKAKIRFEELQNALKSKTLKKEEAEEIQSAINAQAEFLRGSQEVLEITKAINKNIGVKTFGGLEAISKAIPGLNKFSGGFTEASDAAREMAHGLEDAARSGGKGLTKEKIKQLGLEKELGNLSGNAAAQRIKGMSATKKGMLSLKSGFKSLLPSIKKAFGPIFLLTELFSAFKSADKATGDMAKNMNMTYDGARALRGEFTLIAASSYDTFVNTKALQESYILLNSSLGTNVMLNKDNLIFATKMSQQMGITKETQIAINNLSLGTGKSMKKITGEILAQAKISSANNGVALNSKQILEEVKDVTAATTLSLGKNPKRIAEAVTQAKALGMILSQIEKISETILNFESSIQNELKAELLLGRDINLEKARLLALNNDVAGVAREISSQIGDSADFTSMNVIQQKALAEAVGMNREELAKTLFVQENLGAASGKEAEKRKSILNNLVKEVGVEEARRRLEEDSLDTLENQASKQEEFNAAIEKMKEIFVSIAPLLEGIATPLIAVFEVIGFLLSPITMLFGAINKLKGPLGTIVSLIAAASIASMFLFTSMSFGTGLLILAAAAGAIAGFQSMMKPKQPTQVGDMSFGADGKTQISTEEGGLFELSKNDQFVAAPGVADAMNGKGSRKNSQENQEQRQERREQRREQRKTNSLLQEIALATKANKTVEMEDLFGSLYSA